MDWPHLAEERQSLVPSVQNLNNVQDLKLLQNNTEPIMKQCACPLTY